MTIAIEGWIGIVVFIGFALLAILWSLMPFIMTQRFEALIEAREETNDLLKELVRAGK